MAYRLILGLTLCLLAAPLAAGVVYEIEVTDHERSPGEVQNHSVTVEGKNLKMDIRDWRNEHSEVIFRGAQRELVVVDHSDKSYMVIDREMIQDVSSQVSSALAQAQKALENVPEEQRAMVEKMLKERMPQQPADAGPKSKLHKTGETATHNGYATARYDVLLNGNKEYELWIADWSKIEGGDEVGDVFLEMGEFFREMMDSFSAMGGGSITTSGSTTFFEHMNDLDGFPVISKDFDGETLESESTLRSAKRQAIDPDAFEPPSGYKRRQMMPITGQ